ncbi:MAG: DUF6320 domain-containing protein [Bacillota bacterium]|jgi:hypothetical protein
MNKCDYCNVLVDEKLKRCPLCFKSLGDKKQSGNSLYPPYNHINSKKRSSFGFKLALFATIASISICTIVNLAIWQGSFWTIYVIVSILYAWLLVKNTLMSKKPGGFKVLLQLVVVSAMLYIIDFLFGRNNWSVNVVIPFMIISAITFILIMVATKKMLWSDYISYIMAMIFLGFVPILLYILGISTLLFPSLLAASYAILALCGMFIFRDKQFKSEFIRRFHI